MLKILCMICIIFMISVKEALKISTIVKFSQNVLLGFAAFAISIYWTVTNNQSATAKEAKPTVSVIWERFPKFVLGFIAASLPNILKPLTSITNR